MSNLNFSNEFVAGVANNIIFKSGVLCCDRIVTVKLEKKILNYPTT